jgi:hypothetical protein
MTKKQSSAAPSSGASKNNSNAAQNKSISIEEQLDKALTALSNNRQSSFKLFRAWRAQLFRLSVLVFVVVLSMVYRPSKACLQQINAYNERLGGEPQDDEHEISFVEAMKYVLEDSLMETLAVACGMCLVLMLYDVAPPGPPSSSAVGNNWGDDFASTAYRLSCSLIPGIITLYYQNHARPYGQCLPGDMTTAESQSTTKEEDGDGVKQPGRSFPIIIVFHLITSLALWFMKYQMKQHQSAVDKVLKLKHNLVEQERRQGKGKSTTSSSSSSSSKNSKKKKN